MYSGSVRVKRDDESDEESIKFERVYLLVLIIFSLLDGTPYFKIIRELNKIKAKNIQLEDQHTDKVQDIALIMKSKAYRGDLQKEPISYGNTDIKQYSSNDHHLFVQSGPVSPNDEIFDWKSFDDISHDEHPETWNFSAILVQYLWS
jgi:Phospholipase B